MTFKNKVKNEIVTRDAPCGFSKSRHKKMIKNKIAKDISLEDIDNLGYGFGIVIKTFRDGIARALVEDEKASTLESEM